VPAVLSFATKPSVDEVPLAYTAVGSEGLTATAPIPNGRTAVGVQVAAPSVDTNTPLLLPAAYTTCEFEGATAICVTLPGAVLAFHVAPPSGLR